MYLCCIENHLKLKDMTRQEIMKKLIDISVTENGKMTLTSKRTIWEIFCYQNDIDEDSQGEEAKAFDLWCDLYEVK
jgi:hypothetical protein